MRLCSVRLAGRQTTWADQQDTKWNSPAVLFEQRLPSEILGQSESELYLNQTARVTSCVSCRRRAIIRAILKIARFKSSCIRNTSEASARFKDSWIPKNSDESSKRSLQRLQPLSSILIANSDKLLGCRCGPDYQIFKRQAT